MNCCDKYYNNRSFNFCPECGRAIVRSGSRPGYKTNIGASYVAEPPRESNAIVHRSRRRITRFNP